MPEPQTVAEKLLVAAHGLQEEGHSSFSAEDLVVAAWKRFPNTFGLIGYLDDYGKPRYPDSNRVFSEVMGSKPLRKRGLLKKVGQKRYQLTESGASLGAKLSGVPRRAPEERDPEKSGLPRATQKQIRRLLTTKAWRKFSDGLQGDLTFHDACGFWGISPRSDAKQLAARVKNLELSLAEALNEAKGGTLTFGHSGDAFTAGQLKKLRELHELLLQRFDEPLSILRKRSDERKG